MVKAISSLRSAWHAARSKSGSVVVTAVAIGQPLCFLPAHAQDLSFKDFPYVVYCEYEGVARAFYFSRLGGDGIAVYLTPDRQAGTITIDGVARRIGGDQSGTCADKTLDELRSSGQAFDLPN